MKAEIVEIREWYNSKGELTQRTIVYENERNCEHFENCRYFEQLPKKAEKWLERAKREATWINEAKTGNWACKTYRKEP